MCDCFHLAFPNWHGSPGTGAGRRLRGPEPGADDSICDEPSQYIEGERPRPQGSSPVEEYPEKFTDSDKEGDDTFQKGGKKGKKIGFGSLFDKRSTPKMSKLEEAHSPEEGLIVKTAQDGGSEGLIVSGGGKDGIFIKEVVPESPASKSLSVREGDQILSATVYFDNVSYEDALQILEHAQAYKVKLCLKRKPDITESELVLQSEAAHGEEGSSPEMRQHGKTKRHSDARISWPKFPSLGRGRKSHFTRSHSSSEADEQRRLELSPTTSDTESPIKTQDALKSKKKHKIKLSGLRKKSRVSTSVDEETDTLTTGPVNRTGSLEASPLHSPDHHKSTTGETPQVYMMIEDPKVTEISHLKIERGEQSLAVVETKQHKVELINLDSTLKTTDVTVALAAQGSPSPKKSPDGKKKKKKERSELKMRILGKDKSQKTDEKVQSSPKRLQTLGASVDITEPTENEKSAVISSVVSHTEQEGRKTPTDTNTQVINNKSSGVNVTSVRSAQVVEISMPKVDLSLDMSGVGLLRKSPRIVKEKTQKGSPKLSMDTKEKTDTQMTPSFKLPTVDVDDIAMEDTIQKMDVHVEECTTKVKRLSMEGTEEKEDPYDRLRESLSKTQLPKREDIEIPGMEDVSSTRTTAQRIKEPKAIVTGHVEEIQSEAVLLAIDVDRVKEAVSKLPGFKLPRVDTSGMPIPEEITMIDANAQRITVKTQTTPTKVSDAKAKQEAHFSKFDMRGTPDILTRTSAKLPSMIPADLSSLETITETKVEDKKMKYEAKAEAKQSDTGIKVELHQREDIVIRGQESTQQSDNLQARDTALTEEIVLPSLKGSDKKSKKIKMPGFGIAKPDIRFPDVGIDLPKQKLSEPKIEQVKEGSDKLVQEMKKLKTEPKLSKESLPSPTAADTLPSVEVPLPLVKLKSTDSRKEEIEATVVKEETKKEKNIKWSPTKSKLPAFKMPKFGNFSMKGKEEIAGVRSDVKISETKTPTENIDGSTAKTDADSVNKQRDPGKTSDVVVTAPEIQLSAIGKAPSFDSGVTGELIVEQDNKFKLPKFGVSFPKVKGFGVDLHASKPKADVSLAEDLSKPEKKVLEVDASPPKVDISLTDGKIVKEHSAKVEIKPPESEVELKDVDGSPSKFKMPAFKLPKFGAAAAVDAPDVDKDINIKGPDVKTPKDRATVAITQPSIGIEGPTIDVNVKSTGSELEGKGGKFKMPSLGISMPKVKGPEIDVSLSKKDVDVTLPEAKGQVKLPDIEVKEPSAKVKMNAPEIELEMKDAELKGSPSKFKMPSFKLPKFGAATPSVTVEVPDVNKDIHIDGAEIKTPKHGANIDITVPSLDIEGPSLDVKSTGGELEGKGGKFKMPSLGISMPKVKGPEIDVSLSKKDVDVTLPEAKGQVKLPDIEVKEPSAKVKMNAPEIELEMKDAELKGSPSKFKMPSFKLPKFGAATPSVTVEVPDVNKDIHIDGAEIKTPKDGANIDITVPSLDIEGPSLDVKSTGVELEGKGGKFKMPSLGISMPKVKGPEIDVSLSKKDVDVTLPEAKAQVKLPDVEVKKPSAKVDIKAPEIELEMKDAELKGSPSKFKMPSFKLPKFGAATPSVTVEVPDVNKDIHIDGAEVKTPKDGAKIDITVPSLDIEGPSLDVKSTGGELEGKGGKFKMPSLGISMPKVKGPEIDVSLSKKDVDVTLPEAKAQVKLPDVEVKKPSAKVDIKAPEIELEMKDAELKGSPSKFKMPSFKLPKFGAATPSVTVEVPDVDEDIHIDGAEIKTLEDGANIDITVPSLDIEGPSLDVKSTGVELEGKGSKFKMPSLGLSMPKVKGPEIDLSSAKKDVDVTLPEAKVEVKLPDVEVPETSAAISVPEAPTIEVEAKMKKPSWSFPRFSFSKPSVKAPDVDVTLPDVDVSLPEGKVEGKEPDLEIKAPEIEVELKDTEGSPSKFTMPTFKLPKFGTVTPSVAIEVPDVDKDIKIDGAELKFPKEGAAIDITVPTVDIEGPSLDVNSAGAELDGKGGKFKMPSLGLSMPKVKGPEIDLNLSTKDVDITLPESKAEVKLPDVEVKEFSAEPPAVEFDAKLKKPRFSLPRISFSKPSVKVPEADVNMPDVDVSLPEGKVEVKEPELEIKPPEIEGELDGQGSKFKMPSFGISLPKVKGPELDLSSSKKDVDVTLPETKAEIKLLDVEVKEPSAAISVPEVPSIEVEAKLKKTSWFSFSKASVKAPEVDLPQVDVSLSEGKLDVKQPEVEIKAPEIEVQQKDVDGSPSKFKMPTFKLPKLGAGTPNVTVELPDVDKDININAPEIKTPKDGAIIDITVPSVDIEGPSIDVKSTGAELEGKGGKFKMPSLGLSMPKVKGPEIDLSSSKKGVDVTLPEVKAEVKLPDVEVKETPAEPPAVELEAKLKKPRFSLPRFSFSKSSVKEPEVDVNIPDVDVSLPEGKVEMKEQELDIKAPETDVELDGQGSKFKMPSFGISLPKVKGPEIDLSLAKKDVDVTLPEAKVEVKLPDVEVPETSAAIPVPEAPTIEVDAKMKKQSWSLPRFSFSKSSVKAPEVDVNLPDVDVSLPEGKVEVKEPELEIKPPEIEVELKVTEGSPSKFKMPAFKLPNFGAATPSATVEVPDVDKDINIKGPEIDLNFSKKDVDVTLPEAKAEVKLPDVEVPETSAAISVPEAPTIEVEAKLKKTSWFSFSKASVKAPEVDVNLPQVDVSLPEGKVEVKEPELEIKVPEIEVELKGTEGSPSKFKMPTFKIPKFGTATPNVAIEVPEVDKDIKIEGAELKFPKEGAAIDITVPTVDIEGPSLDVKSAGAELEGKGGKFKMPSLGLSMPKVKGPEIDLSSSKKDVDVTLPEVKAEVKLPDVEVKETPAEPPAVELEAKLKKPRFSLPRFSFSKPSVKEPEVDVNITAVDVSLPEGTVEMKEPELDIKAPETDVELDGQGSKFKMPSFGISLPKVKGPEIDLSLAKKDVDVTLPEAKVEVKLPDVEVPETSAAIPVPEASAIEVDAKMKKQSWSLPRFSFSKSSVKAPKVDVNLPDVDVSLPEGKMEVKEPELEIKPPEIEVELKVTEGSPSKFKMPAFKLPNFGAATPSVTVEVPDVDKDINIKGPEIDLNFSKKDVDVTLPEAKAEVKLPDVEVPETSAAISVPEAPTIEVEAKLKKTSWFSFSKASVKAPEVDVNLPQVDVSLPEGKVEVKEPELEIKVPEIEVELKGTEGSPSKFKMPTFKIPKFGTATPNVAIEVPEVDKDIKIEGAELKFPKEGAAIDITVPTVDIEGPSLDVKSAGAELEGKGGKFKMPSLGLSMPKVKGPEIDLSSSKKDVDVTLPEVKAEVKLPDVEVKETPAEPPAVELEAKLKKPRFSLPRFSFSKPSVKEPEVDVNIPDVDVSLPEGKVEMKEPELDIKAPVTDVELDGQGSKFKMPSFGISLPKVKGPEIDLSLAKKDVDVTLPEAKVEVKFPDVEVPETSAAIPVPEAPAIEVDAKMKKQSWSLPRFSFSKSSVKAPEVDVNLPDVDVSLPEGKVEVKEPELEIKPPEIEVELKDTEGSPSKLIKIPKFGAATPSVTVEVPDVDKDINIKGPEIDLNFSKKDVDVTLPEAKADVNLPDVEVKESSAAISVPDAPTIEVEAKLKKPSWSMPRFSFSKQSVKAPEVDATLEAPEIDATLPEVKQDIILPDVEVKEPSGAILVDEPPAVELDAKLKKSRFSLPRFSFSKQSIKEPETDVNLPEVDVSLPEGKVGVKKPEVVKVEVKQSNIEVKPPESEAELKDIEGSPSKFKMSTFKLSKFGATTPIVTVEVPYVDEDIHIEGDELRFPEEDAAVDIKVPSVDSKAVVSNTGSPKQETAAIDSEMPKTEADSPAHGSPSKFKLPSFKMPRLSFSKPKPDDEHVPVPADTEFEDDHLEIQAEPQGSGKSPILTFTSFGEILKTIDVEFDVPLIDEEEEKLTPSKEEVAVPEPKELTVQSVAEIQLAQKEDEVAEIKSKPRFKFPRLSFSRSPEESETLASTNVVKTTGVEKWSEGKEKETNIKQESSKSPERVGWLKFPKLGLSSPSEPAKIAEKEEQESEKSPVGDTMDDDVSTTYSLWSSDAFADISSTVTSEQVGLSSSSPTKVTVKYCDPNADVGLGEVHGNVITSTMRTELISVEPNLPEKVTILSSRESSSSVDTLRLEPGNIHVITSNIQATPEAQHATRLSEFHVESAGGLSLKPEFKDGASWSVEESRHTESGQRTIIEKHVVRETSGEHRETVVITKQVTHVFGVESSEPISGETASSIRRLKDSVHYDKIKFFEEAQK